MRNFRKIYFLMGLVFLSLLSCQGGQETDANDVELIQEQKDSKIFISEDRGKGDNNIDPNITLSNPPPTPTASPSPFP